MNDYDHMMKAGISEFPTIQGTITANGSVFAELDELDRIIARCGKAAAILTERLGPLLMESGMRPETAEAMPASPTPLCELAHRVHVQAGDLLSVLHRLEATNDRIALS